MTYEINIDWNNRYLNELNFDDYKNFKACKVEYEKYVFHLIKNKQNLSIKSLIFILFKMEKMLKLKIGIINLIKKSRKLEIVEIFKKSGVLFLSQIERYKQIYNILIEVFDDYFKNNEKEINDISEFINQNFKNEKHMKFYVWIKLFWNWINFNFY